MAHQTTQQNQQAKLNKQMDKGVLVKPSDLTWRKREHVHGIRI